MNDRLRELGGLSKQAGAGRAFRLKESLRKMDQLRKETPPHLFDSKAYHKLWDAQRSAFEKLRRRARRYGSSVPGNKARGQKERAYLEAGAPELDTTLRKNDALRNKLDQLRALAGKPAPHDAGVELLPSLSMGLGLRQSLRLNPNMMDTYLRPAVEKLAAAPWYRQKTAKQYDSKGRIGGPGEVLKNYGAHTTATIVQTVLGAPILGAAIGALGTDLPMYDKIEKLIKKQHGSKVPIRHLSILRGMGGMARVGTKTGVGSINMGIRSPEVLAHEWGHLNQPRFLRAIGGGRVRTIAPLVSGLAGITGLVASGKRAKPEDKAKQFAALSALSAVPAAGVLANEVGATITGHRKFKGLLGSRALRKMLPGPILSYAVGYGLAPATLGALALRYKHLAKKRKASAAPAWKPTPSKPGGPKWEQTPAKTVLK